MIPRPGQSVVLGMNTTTYVPLVVLPSDGEITLVTECVAEGSALVLPVE